MPSSPSTVTASSHSHANSHRTTKRARFASTHRLDAAPDLSAIACKRCRSRKVKCDGEFPSCLGCVKAQVPCIIADYSTLRDYTRAEVKALQDKLLRLEAALGRTSASSNPVSPALHLGSGRTGGGPDDGQDDDPSPASSSAPRFVGTENGIGFFLSGIHAFRNQSHNALNNLFTPQPQSTSIFYCAPHSFPSTEIASLAINEYFREFHLSHPFLDPKRIASTLSSRHALSSSPSRSAKHALFQLNMVLAIGGVRLFRDGIIDLHPFGFFTAALEVNPPSDSAFDSLEDIENLLLIARFGIYYNIGCSIWELGRLCVRTAIELNLHQQRLYDVVSGTEYTQRARKVFWESYNLDRFSSSTLGRPFAIDDAAISTELPTDVPRYSIDGPDQASASDPQSSRSETAIFIWLIRLGQITSGVHYSMHQQTSSRKDSSSLPSRRSPTTTLLDRTVGTSDIFSQLRQFHGKLREWRRAAPRFEPPTCLFETQEFFELTYQERRMWLLRAAIDKLPGTTASPPEHLTRPCLQAACSIINSFNELKRKNLVTFTRAFTHLIFLASLVVVSVMNTQMHNVGRREERSLSEVDVDHWLADLDDGSPQPGSQEAWETLSVAGDILVWFAEQMPDVAVYTRLFEALKQGLARPASQSCRRSTSRRSRAANGAEEANQLARLAPAPALTPQVPRDVQQGIAYEGLVGDDGVGSDMGQGILPMDSGMMNIFDLTPYMMQSDNVQMTGSDVPLLQNSYWTFPNVLGMEGIDSGISGYIWDMMPPWEGSPSASLDT